MPVAAPARSRAPKPYQVASNGPQAAAPRAVKDVRPLQPAPTRVVSARPAPSPVAAVPAGEKRVSLDFVQADINDVLKALALQAGVNIATAADVKGSVTVSLNRVTLTEALDMVTGLSGFQYARGRTRPLSSAPRSHSNASGTSLPRRRRNRWSR